MVPHSSATPTMVLTTRLLFLRCRMPKATASGMKHMDAMATEPAERALASACSVSALGTEANVPATMSVNAATTSSSTR